MTAVDAARPPEYPVGQCRSCHAPVIWALLDGSPYPVDAEPVSPNGGGGNILLSSRGAGPSPIARKVRHAGELFGKTRVFRSHFDTCPYAARHRGAGRATRRRRAS